MSINIYPITFLFINGFPPKVCIYIFTIEIRIGFIRIFGEDCEKKERVRLNTINSRFNNTVNVTIPYFYANLFEFQIK